jgi:transcriptional regulator NrdR family protein
MICPECRTHGTFTYDSRKFKDPENDFLYVERRRRCKDATCAFRFSTTEIDSWLFASLLSDALNWRKSHASSTT